MFKRIAPLALVYALASAIKLQRPTKDKLDDMDADENLWQEHEKAGIIESNGEPIPNENFDSNLLDATPDDLTNVAKLVAYLIAEENSDWTKIEVGGIVPVDMLRRVVRHMKVTDARFTDITEAMCDGDHPWLMAALRTIVDVLRPENRESLRNVLNGLNGHVPGMHDVETPVEEEDDITPVEEEDDETPVEEEDDETPVEEEDDETPVEEEDPKKQILSIEDLLDGKVVER